MTYGVRGHNTCEVVIGTPACKIHTAPDNLNHRHISEDVPYGLVSLASTSKAAGVKTPCINSIVQPAVRADGVYYRSAGRTPEKPGIQEWT